MRLPFYISARSPVESLCTIRLQVRSSSPPYTATLRYFLKVPHCASGSLRERRIRRAIPPGSAGPVWHSLAPTPGGSRHRPPHMPVQHGIPSGNPPILLTAIAPFVPQRAGCLRLVGSSLRPAGGSSRRPSMTESHEPPAGRPPAKPNPFTQKKYFQIGIIETIIKTRKRCLILRGSVA